MPSTLRYFCCACGTNDSKANYSGYPNAPKRKRKSKSTTGSSTFTDRRLLHKNDNRSNGDSFQQMVFHQQSRDISLDSQDYNDSAAKLLSGKAKSKRRKVQEIFMSDQLQNGMSRTTFPWMDENFTPNGCSNIRLGVSSVHLHARRKSSNDNDNRVEELFSHSPDSTRQVDEGSNASHSRLSDVNNVAYRYKSYSTEYDCREQQTKNGDSVSVTRSVSFGDDTSSTRASSATKSHLAGKNVTRRSSEYRGDQRITKSDDLKLLPPTDVSHLARPYRRQHASIQNVFNNIDVTTARVNDKLADTSVSSQVSARTAISSTSDKSRISKQPLTVIPKIASKNISKSCMPNFSEMPAAHDPRASESMYGYVPKIVQSVQASNALEGSRIDDFFMNCHNDRELHSFASAQEIQTPRSQNQHRESVGRSSSVPSRQVDRSSTVSRTKSENINMAPVAGNFETQQFTVEFGSQDSLDTDSVFLNNSRANNNLTTNNQNINASHNLNTEDIARYSRLDGDQLRYNNSRANNYLTTHNQNINGSHNLNAEHITRLEEDQLRYHNSRANNNLTTNNKNINGSHNLNAEHITRLEEDQLRYHNSRANNNLTTNNKNINGSHNLNTEHITRYSRLDGDQAQIPFIDQEPDLIQGLQNIKVGNDNVKHGTTVTSVHSTTPSEKELFWEQTFRSQNEYIESQPLKIPYRPTPPISRKEGLSISNKNHSKNNHWLSNFDAEVLY